MCVHAPVQHTIAKVELGSAVCVWTRSVSVALVVSAGAQQQFCGAAHAAACRHTQLARASGGGRVWLVAPRCVAPWCAARACVRCAATLWPLACEAYGGVQLACLAGRAVCTGSIAEYGGDQLACLAGRTVCADSIAEYSGELLAHLVAVFFLKCVMGSPRFLDAAHDGNYISPLGSQLSSTRCQFFFSLP